MSRFFRSGGDSSSESSEEEDLYSEGEEEEEDNVQKDDSDDSDDSDEDDEDDDDSDSSSEGGHKGGAARFLKGESSDSEDSDEEVRKKVRSAKDKRHEELETTIKHIDNAQKIDDWGSIATEYDKLNRQVARLLDGNKAPKIYIQAIANLEDYMNETIAKQKVTPKKMNATSARGLNAVKQKIKKHNKDHQEQIEAYRADNFDFMVSDDEEEEEAPKPKKVARFLDETTMSALDDDEGFAPVGKGGKAVQYTPESIFKHLRGIMESRGKKNTDKVEQIKVMEKLYNIAVTPYQKIRVLLTIVSARFDVASGTAATMPLEQWKSAEREFSSLLEILNTSKEYVVAENAEEWDDDDKAPTMAEGEKFIKVPGSIVSYVERLDDELIRSLQSIDPHTPEYIERLQDEGALYNAIFGGLLYYEYLRKETTLPVPQESINRIVMRRLDHVYFKPAQVVKTFEENCWKAAGESVESSITARAQASEPHSLVQTLSNYLFDNSEGILRARAMLCHVYFMALHGEYYKARDMSLMSHLQETIPNFDVQTQILYNRTIVQVGLCAFRKGLIYDAQHTLQEVCGSGRQKELLAQGVMIQRYSQVSPEQERLEKQRQLPFHMHINLELLECVYLTCSMLLEIPLLAQTGSSPDIRKRIISKTYRRMLEYHERQIFTGPPENTRDHVMQASKALAQGEWKKSIEFVHAIKIWELMPNSDDIKAMLSKQVQEEGLRTFLFTYAPYYDTLSVPTLSDMFELTDAKVSAVVMKMMSHEELSASLDNTGSTIIFHKGVELSRLQGLSLALADKASNLIETNERTLEHRTQGSSNAFERQGGRGGRGGRGRGGRGGGSGRGGPREGGGHTQRQAGGTQFTGGALGNAVRG